MAPKTGLSRRDFVKDAGGLLIGFSLLDASVLPQVLGAATPDAITAVSPSRLDAWLRIEMDGSIRVFTGKADIGMGVETAYGQIVAEELDVAPGNVSFVMGDTATTSDQGGVGGSTSIMLGSKPLRNVAATARYLLLQLASRRFGVAAEQLQIRNSVISVKGDESKNVSFGALAGGTDLDDALKVSGTGFALNVEGMGKPKDPSTYTVVGKPALRVDMPGKIYGTRKYVTEIRVPNMLHGRVVRPAGVGSKVVKVDQDSIKGMPGNVQAVVKGNFVAVVADNEWAAIQAAKKLKVTWSAPTAAFPEQKDLYKYMRTTSPKASTVSENTGDAAAAIAGAAKKVEAKYDFPFQSHATMGPGCAVADVHLDGVTTVWSGGQKPHAMQKGFAELLGVPLNQVRVIWVEDAGSYGRPGFEDAAADAILLSREVGKPVRVQWMRADMTSWGTKGPAVACDLSAGIDAQGEVTALQFTSYAFSGGEVNYQPATAGNFLGAQLSGVANTAGVDEFARWGAETAPYKFQNLHAAAHVVHAFFDTTSPLRCTHLRDPEGPATSFATESFMDEVAAAAGADPVEFRIKYLSEPRAKAVLTAAAEKAGWDKRPSPEKITRQWRHRHRSRHRAEHA